MNNTTTPNGRFHQLTSAFAATNGWSVVAMRSLATKFLTITAIVVTGATVLTPAAYAGSKTDDAMALSSSVVESDMPDIEAFLTNDFVRLSGDTRESLSKTIDHAAVTDLKVVGMPGVPSAVSLSDFEAADPEIVVDGEDIYLYSTNTFVFNPLNLPVHLHKMESHEWWFLGDAMPDLGSWAEEGNTWAPGVHEVDGRWVVYYTARVAGTTGDPAFPAGEQCIGVAVADKPKGPFVDSSDAPFICQHDLGGSIDASPFTDVDGTMWLSWKSDSNAPHVGGVSRLYSQQLTADGLGLVGSPTVLMVADQAWERPLIENPDFVRRSDGTLMLTYSAGWWANSSYSTGMALCKSPAGGCVKTGQWLTTGDGLVGPGGASFLTVGESRFVAFHTWHDGTVFSKGGFRSMVFAAVDL